MYLPNLLRSGPRIENLVSYSERIEIETWLNLSNLTWSKPAPTNPRKTSKCILEYVSYRSEGRSSQCIYSLEGGAGQDQVFQCCRVVVIPLPPKTNKCQTSKKVESTSRPGRGCPEVLKIEVLKMSKFLENVKIKKTIRNPPQWLMHCTRSKSLQKASKY